MKNKIQERERKREEERERKKEIAKIKQEEQARPVSAKDRASAVLNAHLLNLK